MFDDPHLGAFTTDAQKTRIAGIHARMRTHYDAVKQAEKGDLGAEPELVEYAARWRAFMAEMNALGERANAVFSWVTDSDIDQADASLNLLLKEWQGLSTTIELRKGKRVLGVLEDAKKRGDLRPSAGPADPLKLRVPNTSVKLPDSAASKAPDAPAPAPKAPPDPAFGVKVGVVGALAVGTVISAATAKGDAARAGFAIGGSALTIAAGVLLFGASPEKPDG